MRATAFLAAGLMLVVACQRPAPIQSQEVVTITVTNEGAATFNGEKLSMSEFEKRLSDLAARNPDVEIHFAPEVNADFEVAAKVLALTLRLGLRKIGVVGGT